MIIIMLGAPATGKGSVAELLSMEYNIPAISSGDIFRKNISEKTELGLKADEYIKRGELVPDDITVSMIESSLAEDDTKNGMILDGFPRTVKQAEDLDKMLKNSNSKIDIVINLESPEDEIIKRIANRRICSKCKAIYNTVLNPSKVDGICDKCGSKLYQREDDTEERAKNRLKIYEKQTAPLTEYYKDSGVLYTTTVSEKINRLKHEVAKDVIEYLKNK